MVVKWDRPLALPGRQKGVRVACDGDAAWLNRGKCVCLTNNCLIIAWPWDLQTCRQPTGRVIRLQARSDESLVVM